MKKITVSILTTLLMLSMVFSSSVFAAEKEQSAWDSFLGLFSAKTAATSDVGVEYRGHIQNVGNYPLDGSWIQGPTELGTEGQGLRLEGFWIKLTNQPDDVNIEYEVHVQNVGWMDPVENGAFAGTEGKSLQIEAIKINLVKDNGDQVTEYSVKYKGHVQNIGDTDWYMNGEQLGTVGSFLRLEALEVEIIKNPADMTAYDEAVANAGALTQADYTAASWAALQTALTNNVVTEDNTQAEVDAATAAITSATNALVMVPRVVSVNSLNAKQIEVVFNMAMNKSTLINDNGTAATTDDVVLATALSIQGLDSQGVPNAITVASANGVLSADGKILTVTPQTTEWFKDRYAVTVGGNTTTPIKTTAGATVAKYTQNITVKDTTRPVYQSISTVDFQTVDVTFSEPVPATSAVAGNFSFKLANGSALTGADPAISLVNHKIRIDMTGIDAADNNKDITVTMTGVADYAGNVMTPNPVTFTIKKDTTATTKPVISSITVTGGATYDILFSSALVTPPTVTTGVAATTLVKDVSNAALYHATAAATQSGLTTITYTTFVGTNGVTGDAGSTTANFSADSAALAITSSRVEKIDGVENLVITYNKYVTPVDNITIAGTYVDNYVTTAMSPSLVTDTNAAGGNATFALYKPVDGKSMSVKLALDALTKSAAYTVTLPEGLVTDLFTNNSAKVTNFVFTRTSDSSIDAPEVASVVQGANNDLVTVTFDKPVDGASAITAANYIVEGATISSAELTSNSPVGVVKLTLVKNTNTFTGLHAVSISGVKSQSGDVMTAITTSATLNENVRPNAKTAKITAVDTITLTMSENIDPLTIANTDYKVFVGGTEVAVTSVAAGATADLQVITLTNNLTASNIAAGVVVKPATSITSADIVGNVVEFTQITAAQ